MIHITDIYDIEKMSIDQLSVFGSWFFVLNLIF
jgi:hypothetical protein